MRVSVVRSGAYALLASFTLAACGGGGGGSEPAPGAPVIEQYAADKPAYRVGERARLTVRFSGGAGRIEPGLGTVSNGASVDTPPLDITTRYTLVVENNAGTVRRDLDLPVTYRNVYRPLAKPFLVSQHHAVLAGDGTVVIVGGSRGGTVVSSSIDRFDPRTESFAKIGELLGGPFQGETVTRLADGRILVYGARLQSGSPYAELIDERTGTATATGNMDVPRIGHAAVAISGNRVLITGGYTPEGHPFGVSPTAVIWEAQHGQFRAVAKPMKLPRAGHSATLLKDGRVLIVGGYSYAKPYQIAEIFDPATEEFTAVPSNDQTMRALHESVLLSDGNVLVVAGEDDLSKPHGSVLLWDRSSGVFLTMPNLLVPRSLVRAGTTRADFVLLFGGVTQHHPVATGSAEIYSRTAGGLALPAMPKARAWHTVTRLNDGRVLILGGEDDDQNLIAEAMIYE